MSHFSVAILTKGKPSIEDIEDILAPYQENNCGDCPEKYMEFYDYENYRTVYENETTKAYQLFNGEIVEYPTDEQKDGATEITISFKELYDTFEQFLEKYLCACYDEEKKQYGYWENPDARWDWWVLGGRWAGLLKLPKKNTVSFDEMMSGIDGKETDYSRGEKSPFSDYDPYESQEFILADIARVKDIITEPEASDVTKSKLFWELKIEEREPVNDEEKKIKDGFMLYTKKYYLEKYKTKEKYIDLTTRFQTYAVITKDGEWIEPGTMGWWGCSNALDEDEETYLNNYHKLVFENADEDDYITIVDCHI